MLRMYYTNLGSKSEKNKFIAEVMEKCRVNYPVVRSWLAPTASKTRRIPKPVYRGILSEITGMPENKLFREV